MSAGESIRRSVGVGLAVASSVFLFANCDASPNAASHAPGITQTLPGSTTEGNPDICYEPTPAEITDVEILFDEPPLTETSKAYDKGGKDINFDKIAAKFGLTIPNSALQNDSEAAYSEHASYSTQLSIAQRYLAEFGVSLTVAVPGELSKGSSQVPTRAELHTHMADYDINEITEAFLELPLQYITLSCLKHIVLAARTPDYAYAIVTHSHNTIAVDVTHQDLDPQLVDHEDYHLLDKAECGSVGTMYADPGYSQLNGPYNIYVGSSDKPGFVTFTGPQIQETSTELINAQNSGKKVLACTYQAKFNNLLRKVVAYSNYGLTNVVEDKAELGRNIASLGDYSDIISSRTPILKRKFEYLLARLYHFNPKLVEYFAAASTRPDPNEYQIADCSSKG